MKLKNLFTKEAQNTYSEVTGGIKKKIKPVIDMGSELVRQNVEAIQPAIQPIQQAVTNIANPIIEPIKEAKYKKIIADDISKFLADEGIDYETLMALPDDDGATSSELLSFLQKNGIKVQGMEEMQAQQEMIKQEEANKPFALDVAPEYDEVTALSGLTGAIPKYEYSPEDSMLKSTGKMIGNLPVSGLQMAGAVGDIGLSYLRNLDQGPVDAFTETAKAKIINPTIAQAYGIKDIAQEGYNEGGVVGSANKLLEKGSEFIVENPVGAIMTGKSLGGSKRGLQAIKTAGQEAMKGNIGTATTGLIKSTGIGLKENIYDPIKMGVTAPITAVKLGAKGIGAIAKKTETGKGIAKKVENAKTRLAGIDENEIGALEKTSPSEIDAILKQAEQTKGKQGDYVQTPYHVGAEKAKKTLNKLDTDLKTRQSERIAILDESPITKIDATDARTTLKDSLRSMNVEDIQIVDGAPKIIPVKGREALLDLSNPADVKALQKLNEILDGDVSPTQTMDRVKKLQEWAYENKSTIGVKGTSEIMDGLIKRVQGSLNSTFKKQLPEEYAKVLDSMSEDIKLSNEIKRLFGIDDNGNPIGNRGELVMKRLANGTTTGGEARILAKQIYDRYGIDLIKEARLRQMAMDLVGDARGQTLFGVIKGGKQGIIDKALEYTVGKIVNKEKLLRGIAKGKGEQVKNTEPIYIPNAFRKAMSEEAKKPIGLPAPTGKSTGAKNVRVNQPVEKSPIKNEGQVGVRPGTKANIKTPEEVQLAKQTQRQEQFRQVERDLNTALLSKYNPNKPKATKEFLDRAITQGRITKEEAITLVENLYEKADGWNKPHYERMLNDLYSNKKIESWDDLLNEKQVKTVIKTPRQEFLETPEGIYREIQKKANDRRYNPDKADALIAKFKEKTGIDLMTEKTPNFDKDGNVVKVIKKRTPTNEKKEKFRTAEDLNNTQLTTKILKGLGDRETASKEFIRNMTNSGDVKQVEKDIIRGLLESEGDKVNVDDFKKKVQAELLPLKRKNSGSAQIRKDLEEAENEISEKLFNLIGDETPSAIKERKILNERRLEVQKEMSNIPKSTARYEGITLPSEIRGRVANYIENIYESPIETSAGNAHFTGDTKNYFGHTRIEDMADGSTRRVIEVQSDLFQKGNLEREKINPPLRQLYEHEKVQAENAKKRDVELAKLSQYNDPTAHFRMIREEVSKAVEDGKTKLQFPTGETAMKIEGLGERNNWETRLPGQGSMLSKVTPENMKVGMEVSNGYNNYWIITEVLGDGKFKAINARVFESFQYKHGLTKKEAFQEIQSMNDGRGSSSIEAFDISGKVNQDNPIYKFYEKEVGRYLKNKYDAKLVTDDKGVSWYQVDVKDSMGGPVEAFRQGVPKKQGIERRLTVKNLTDVGYSEEASKKFISNTDKYEVQQLNKQFFGDDSVQMVEKIESNKKALGSYKNGMIKIVEGQANPSDTFHHEAVHKYLDVFATKDEATAILEEARTKYKQKDYANAEEMIAEDFIKFAKNRTGVTGKIKVVFENIINRIKIYLGKGDNISQMYRDILAGKGNKGISKKEGIEKQGITKKK